MPICLSLPGLGQLKNRLVILLLLAQSFYFAMFWLWNLQRDDWVKYVICEGATVLWGPIISGRRFVILRR